jgi:hypothetical protein
MAGLYGRCRRCYERDYHRRRQEPEWRARSNETRRVSYRRTLRVERRRGFRATREAGAQKQAIVNAWKSAGCVDFSRPGPRGIEADHLPQFEKLANISDLVGREDPVERLPPELASANRFVTGATVCAPSVGGKPGRLVTSCGVCVIVARVSSADPDDPRHVWLRAVHNHDRDSGLETRDLRYLQQAVAAGHCGGVLGAVGAGEVNCDRPGT